MAAAVTPDGAPVAINQVVEQYQREFQEQYDNIRQALQESSTEFKEAVANATALLKEAERDPAKRFELGIVQPLKNLSDVAIPDLMLLHSFLWTAIVMLGYWIGYTLLSVIFHPLLALLLTDFQALMSTIALLVLANKSLYLGNDYKSRFNLLYFAIAEGIVVGYVLGDLHLHLPLPFVVPLMVAAFSHLLAKNGKTQRTLFLAAALVSGLLTNCLLGWILADLTFSYLLTAVLYSVCACLTLQYYMEHWDNDYEKKPHVYMFNFLCSNVLIQAIAILLFGSKGGSGN